MTTNVPVVHPGERAKRIELVAAIVFGRDPADPTRALPGWQAKLSVAMGMGRTAVNDTLKMASSDVFDRKLHLFIARHRLRLLHEDIPALETLEKIFGANDPELHKYSDRGVDE